MKWLNGLAAALVGGLGLKVLQEFNDKYELVLVDKDDIECVEKESPKKVSLESESFLDLRGTPTHACVCGSQHFYVRVIFENYEIATYFLDMQCTECGALLTAPTPLDRKTVE